MIGVARGSHRGGYWSLSYVRKPFKNASIALNEKECFSGGGSSTCTDITTTKRLDNVFLKGVDISFFVPVVTFKNRIQVGIHAGGGVGFPEGTIVTSQKGTYTSTFNNQTNVQTIDETEEEPATEVIFALVPLVRVEAAGAILLAPGLKVRVAGGLNYPSKKAFSVAVVYLFGVN